MSLTSARRSYWRPGADDGVADTFGRGDVWILRFNEGQIDDGISAAPSQAGASQANAPANIGRFVNGENVFTKTWWSGMRRISLTKSERKRSMAITSVPPSGPPNGNEVLDILWAANRTERVLQRVAMRLRRAIVANLGDALGLGVCPHSGAGR